MRHRTTLLALASLTLLVASAPRAEAISVRTPPAAAASDGTSHAVTVPAVPVRTADSLYVFVLTQLVVPDSVSRDSVVLASLADRAVAAMVGSLAANQIVVYRVAAFTRSSASVSHTSRLRYNVLPRYARRSPFVRSVTTSIIRNDVRLASYWRRR